PHPAPAPPAASPPPAKNGARANLVCFDCTFVDCVGGENSRHMGIEDDMLMKEKLTARGIIDKNTKIVISHFSHNGNPTRERLARIEKQYDVTAAYDGYETEI
ncbi:MAG: hypothetical protein K2N33_01800, partial [Clostridia bacterium]|nr:hypothetical protein [Clostridia bacterium]